TWRRLTAELANLEASLRPLAARFAEDPELQAFVEQGNEAALQQAAEAAERAADQIAAKEQEIGAIQEKLQTAGMDGALGAARARAAEALAAIGDVYDDQLERAVATNLCNVLREQFRSEQEPELLKRARVWFETFTRGVWSLDIDEQGVLGGRLPGEQRLRPLDELSTGTRMQLLLAINLAWIEAREDQGPKLPLFLDEALTVADESRFQEIARALEQVAENGRQVIYLCARQQDAETWRHLTGHAVTVIDLGKLRRLDTPELPPLPDTTASVRQIPRPDPAKLDAWAKAIGVPPIRRWSEPEAIHLFHLLADTDAHVELLWQMLNDLGIDTLGQAESFYGKERLAPDVQELLERRGRIVRAWLNAARVGHGRPVDPAALRAAEIFSPTYIEEACAILQENEGDGTLLLAATRGETAERHFERMRHRDEIAERLEDWLAANEHLPGIGEQLLSVEERLQATIRDTPADIPPEKVRRVVALLERAIQPGQ
ncbi:MAG: hypothetical protein D6761_11210, partial [Candidatus Dadabacteria bacterium]